MLELPLVDYNPIFIFSLTICIRMESVEEVFNMFSGLPSKYYSTTMTTITRLESFTGNQGEYKVVAAEDIASAGRVLSAVIRDKILPFLNHHQDIAALDKAVNREHPGIDSTQNPTGAMHSVILAHLARNKDFDQLVAKHRTSMQQFDPDIIRPFNELVEYLKAH